MTLLKNILAFSMGLASLGGAYAKLDLSSSNNVVVYWGEYRDMCQNLAVVDMSTTRPKFLCRNWELGPAEPGLLLRW